MPQPSLLVSRGTAGGRSRSFGRRASANVSIQELPERQQIVGGHDDASANDRGGLYGTARKHLRRVRAHMRDVSVASDPEKARLNWPSQRVSGT